jgi:hypothetical protein
MIFKQVFCFLFDGTSRHLTYFDDLKKGPSGFTVGKDLGLHRKSIWLF